MQNTTIDEESYITYFKEEIHYGSFSILVDIIMNRNIENCTFSPDDIIFSTSTENQNSENKEPTGITFRNYCDVKGKFNFLNDKFKYLI